MFGLYRGVRECKKAFFVFCFLYESVYFVDCIKLERENEVFLHVVLKRGIKYCFGLFDFEEMRMILSFVAGLLLGLFWFRKRGSSVIPVLLVISISLAFSWLSVYAFLPLSWPLWLNGNPPEGTIIIPEIEALTLYFLWHPLTVKYYDFLAFPWLELLEFFAWFVVINVPIGLLGFLIVIRRRQR